MDFDYDVPEQYKRAGVSLDDRALAWKFVGGYHFNEYFGAEFAYVDASGDPELKFINRTLGNLTLANFDLSGFTFAGVFRYPVTPRFNIFAKGGAFIWSAKAELTSSGIAAAQSIGLTGTNPEDDGVSYVAGAGAEFEVIENMSVRAEWERYDMDAKLEGIKHDDAINFYSFGLLYKF